VVLLVAYFCWRYDSRGLTSSWDIEAVGEKMGRSLYGKHVKSGKENIGQKMVELE
jgi:hypothetical protein